MRRKNGLFLAVAIVSEVAATSALKASDGFSRLWPSLLVVAGYAVAFCFLSLTRCAIPAGVAYEVWSGLGIVLVTASAWLIYGQKLDAPVLCGLGLAGACSS
ncbi:MAG: QacE family quaternary ammonium compound efflux SMR transporter [Xanthomonadaceae bacterium]|nr:QacE family quaternary ammonium compound efflux SMR transporter [Xanthomonadaceae bacterium]